MSRDPDCRFFSEEELEIPKSAFVLIRLHDLAEDFTKWSEMLRDPMIDQDDLALKMAAAEIADFLAEEIPKLVSDGWTAHPDD